MEVRKLGIDGVYEISPKKFGDHRGYFSETYNFDALNECGIGQVFVQDNQSYSAKRGVLRGLHYQSPPMAQDKLVRVIRGSIYDVAVDIRTDSPTYGKWVGLEVSAKKWNQILVPIGFAHGFVTLEDDCEVIYKVSAPYSPECDGGIRFDDPAIGVEWPVDLSEVTLSDKDKAAKPLAETDTGF